MKKHFLAAALIIAGMSAGMAQNATRTTAYNALQAYLRDKDPAMLTKAKENIDKATEHETTKGETKTWVYRGQIYSELYKKETADAIAQIKDVTDPGKRQMMAYADMSSANLMEASKAYLQARNLDAKQVYADDIRNGLRDVNFVLQNMGVANYNQKKYAEALPLFEAALQTLPALTNKLDTNLYVNAANSALYGKNFEKAAEFYGKLADMKYGKGHTYYQLASIYRGMNNEAKAKEAIQKGLAQYPNDPELLVEDVNTMLKAGQMAQAVEKLNTIIAARPNDAGLRLIVGQVYSRMANPQDAQGKNIEKPANFEDLIVKSEEQLKKAVELNPNDFASNYELGYLYYNQSAEYYNRSNSTIKDAAKYGTMWEVPLKKGVEYLEKALSLSPKDRDTMNMLKSSYGLLGDTEKYNQIKERMKAN